MPVAGGSFGGGGALSTAGGGISGSTGSDSSGAMAGSAADPAVVGGSGGGLTAEPFGTSRLEASTEKITRSSANKLPAMTPPTTAEDCLLVALTSGGGCERRAPRSTSRSGGVCTPAEADSEGGGG